jgi:hypothetical protein
MLSGFKQSYAEIKQGIIDFDEDSLSIENLMMLRQFAPTNEEMETLRNNTEDVNILGKPEQLFLEVHFTSTPHVWAPWGPRTLSTLHFHSHRHYHLITNMYNNVAYECAPSGGAVGLPNLQAHILQQIQCLGAGDQRRQQLV